MVNLLIPSRLCNQQWVMLYDYVLPFQGTTEAIQGTCINTAYYKQICHVFLTKFFFADESLYHENNTLMRVRSIGKASVQKKMLPLHTFNCDVKFHFHLFSLSKSGGPSRDPEEV